MNALGLLVLVASLGFRPASDLASFELKTSKDAIPSRAAIPAGPFDTSRDALLVYRLAPPRSFVVTTERSGAGTTVTLTVAPYPAALGATPVLGFRGYRLFGRDKAGVVRTIADFQFGAVPESAGVWAMDAPNQRGKAGIVGTLADVVAYGVATLDAGIGSGDAETTSPVLWQEAGPRADAFQLEGGKTEPFAGGAYVMDAQVTLSANGFVARRVVSETVGGVRRQVTRLASVQVTWPDRLIVGSDGLARGEATLQLESDTPRQFRFALTNELLPKSPTSVKRPITVAVGGKERIEVSLGAIDGGVGGPISLIAVYRRQR